MDERAVLPRTRRAILAGAFGGLAATVIAALDRPHAVAANDPNDLVLNVDNTTTTETQVHNNTLDAPGTVFTGYSLSGNYISGVRGYSTGGPGVRGDSVGGEGVLATSETQVAVRGTSGGHIGVLGITSEHYWPAVYAWHRGEGIAIIGYENYEGGAVGAIPANLQERIGILGHGESSSSIGVKGEAIAIGVEGASAGGIGVSGVSTNNTAVKGQSTNGIGIEGLSGAAQGIGVNGQGQAAGVAGYSQGRGVQGVSETGVGLYGVANGLGTGVFGLVGTTAQTIDPPTNVGVFGHAEQTTASRGVNGSSTIGKGVYGEATTGVGVQAVATTGVALAVSGRVTFNRSGKAAVPKNASYVDVTPPGGLASTANVIATLQTYRTGVYVAAARISYPSAGRVRIYLNKVASTTSSTYVSWLVLG